MTDKNRRGQGLWERATIAGACLGASLTSSGAVSGCEIAPISQVSFVLPVRNGILTWLVFPRDRWDAMKDPSDVTSSPKYLA